MCLCVCLYVIKIDEDFFHRSVPTEKAYFVIVCVSIISQSLPVRAEQTKKATPKSTTFLSVRDWHRAVAQNTTIIISLSKSSATRRHMHTQKTVLFHSVCVRRPPFRVYSLSILPHELSSRSFGWILKFLYDFIMISFVCRLYGKLCRLFDCVLAAFR